VEATSGQVEPAPIEEYRPEQQQWLAWAEEEVGGDLQLARTAAQAAIASLAEGCDSNAAAERALTVVGVSSCRFTDGKAALAGHRLVLHVRGITTAVSLDTLLSVDAKLEPDNSVSLAIQVSGAPTPQAIHGAESTEKVQALLSAIHLAAPRCRTGWAQPDLTQRRQILRDRITDLVMQGFVVVYQTDDQAQLKQPKEFNTNLFIVLLIVGFVLIELPMIIYLIVYLLKRDTILALRIDDWGRLTEQRTA
jgi:hypothetical protein